MEAIMRIPAAVVLSSLALLGACASQAPGSYTITPTEMQDVYGVYPLSNGDVLRVSHEHNRYWAEMHRTGRIEIVPVDSIVFVEKGGSMRFSFAPLPFTTEVRVDGVGDPTASALASAWGQSSGIEREFSE
jgi:hypothetical protein